jgi:hypothetical protein
LAEQSLVALIAPPIRDSTTRFTARVVAVVTPANARDADLRRSAGQTFALSRIERRVNQQEAKSKLDMDDATANDAVNVYTSLVGTDPAAKPRDEAAHKASVLLGRFDV